MKTPPLQIILLCVSAVALNACATHPPFESYAIDPGSGAAPPADSVRYFLPRRLLSVTVQRTRTRRDTVTVRVLPPVPDKSQGYFARMPASAFRDDTAALKTTAGGLLTSFSSTSKDETAASIIDAVALAALVPELAAVGDAFAINADALSGLDPAATAGRPPVHRSNVVCGALAGGLGAGPVGGLAASSNADATIAFKANVVFDPTDPVDLARAEAELCTRGARFKLVTIPVARPSEAAVPGKDAAASAQRCFGHAVAGLSCAPVVYFRRDEPYIFTIYDAGDGAAAEHGYQLVSTALIQLPNVAPIERLQLAAAPGVSTRISAQFSDGMLVGVGSSRPSPALAIAGLPLQLAKAIVSIPSALFQFRIDSTRDAARLVEAQTEAIKAETSRLNAAAALHAKEESVAADASASVATDEDSDLQH